MVHPAQTFNKINNDACGLVAGHIEAAVHDSGRCVNAEKHAALATSRRSKADVSDERPQRESADPSPLSCNSRPTSLYRAPRCDFGKSIHDEWPCVRMKVSSNSPTRRSSNRSESFRLMFPPLGRRGHRGTRLEQLAQLRCHIKFVVDCVSQRHPRINRDGKPRLALCDQHDRVTSTLLYTETNLVKSSTRMQSMSNFIHLIIHSP